MATRPLKVFHGNYDGRQNACVAATSQKQAARCIGTSLHDFRPHYSEITGDSDICAVAMEKPGAVFLRGTTPGATWERRT